MITEKKTNPASGHQQLRPTLDLICVVHTPRLNYLLPVALRTNGGRGSRSSKHFNGCKEKNTNNRAVTTQSADKLYTMLYVICVDTREWASSEWRRCETSSFDFGAIRYSSRRHAVGCLGHGRRAAVSDAAATTRRRHIRVCGGGSPCRGR